MKHRKAWILLFYSLKSLPSIQRFQQALRNFLLRIYASADLSTTATQKRFFIRDTEGSLEFTAKTDYEIFISGNCTKLDINQFKAKAIVHLEMQITTNSQITAENASSSPAKTEKLLSLKKTKLPKIQSTYQAYSPS